MDATERATWFVGDLGDPWVRAIADALPAPCGRIDAPADLPGEWPAGLRDASTVVVHRAGLTRADAERLAVLRPPGRESPRLIACVGPHARYGDWERWSPLVDVMVAEATASETIARHVAAGAGTPARVPTVAAVGPDSEVRRVLVALAAAAGYPAEESRDWDDAPPASITLWDVPVLEPGWADELRRRGRLGRVVALLGFADRETVALARSHGASACLDWPCDPADLAWVLDRLAAAPQVQPARLDAAESVPPAPSRRAKSGRVGRP